MSAAATRLRVVQPGPLAHNEDRGRPVRAAVGVGATGALDRGALRLANRLVGNDESLAGLELLFGGFEARLEGADAVWFAVTGSPGAVLLDGRPVDAFTAVRAEPGRTLTIGPAVTGARRVLAVRGGIDVPAVLGSRSRDTLSGLGPAPVAAGDVLTIGPAPSAPVPALDFLPVPAADDGPAEVRAHRGPRADWFTGAALDALFTVPWRASAQADRIGLRLDPPHIPAHASGVDPHPAPLLERAVTRELPSEPMVAGSVQVPPDGRPTVLLADHPVTGGYPVIAVVADADLDRFAQLRPGDAVLFRHA